MFHLVSGCPEHKIHVQRRKWKLDFAVAGLAQHSGIEQRVTIRMHRLDIPARAARRFAQRDGPAPASNLSSSQRLAVNTFHKNSGVAKLMMSPCRVPSNAASARLVVCAREATFRVTVFMSWPPIIDGGPEIG